MSQQHFKAVVHGMVQGVFFRHHTRKTAQTLGIKGWVKNMPDGTVAVEAVGDTARLEALAEWLRHGPPSARVSKVDIDWSSASPIFSSFEVVY